MAVEFMYAKEYWTGDSRDGKMVDGDGYHYYKMSLEGTILEAFECYELDDGQVVISPVPEMKNVNWINDLGFEDFDVLEKISQNEFEDIKQMLKNSN